MCCASTNTGLVEHVEKTGCQEVPSLYARLSQGDVPPQHSSSQIFSFFCSDLFPPRKVGMSCRQGQAQPSRLLEGVVHPVGPRTRPRFLSRKLVIFQSERVERYT